MDIRGSYSIPSMPEDKYFLIVVDDDSCFCWIYLMNFKSEASKLVQSFVAFIETHFQKEKN